MPNRLISVTESINALLVELDSGQAPDRAYLEHTLTDGYAWALKLDGEFSRLERRMTELAGLLARGDKEHAAELARVRLRAADDAGHERQQADPDDHVARLTADSPRPAHIRHDFATHARRFRRYARSGEEVGGAVVTRPSDPRAARFRS